MTFKPAQRASPLSKTTLMTCPWRAVPNSFKARSDRMAEPGGIIAEPGNPDFLRMRSRAIEASIGKKRNRPPNLVRKDRGLRSSWRPSATSAVVGREPGGRSSSVRRGNRANPSSLRICPTATGLRGCPWWVRLRLIAQGDDTVAEGVGLGCGMGPLGRCEEEVASRVLAELVYEDSEAPRCVTEAASDLGTGDPLNEEGAKSLVLAVGGVGGFEEDLGNVR